MKIEATKMVAKVSITLTSKITIIIIFLRESPTLRKRRRPKKIEGSSALKSMTNHMMNRMN